MREETKQTINEKLFPLDPSNTTFEVKKYLVDI